MIIISSKLPCILLASISQSKMPQSSVLYINLQYNEFYFIYITLCSFPFRKSLSLLSVWRVKVSRASGLVADCKHCKPFIE